MLLGFKTQLKLNSKQCTIFARNAGCAGHVWNKALALTKQILDYNQNSSEQEKINFIITIDLHKWLIALVKSEQPSYHENSKCPPQYALRALRDAWKVYFNKQGGTPKFKNIKNIGKNDSFTLDGTIKVFAINRIQVPKIGILKTYEKLPVGLSPKSVIISRSVLVSVKD